MNSMNARIKIQFRAVFGYLIVMKQILAGVLVACIMRIFDIGD